MGLLLVIAFIPLSHAATQTTGSYEMSAWIAGNPSKITSSQYSSMGFAYPIANYTSVLPEYVSMWVISPGNSTVEVESGTGTVFLQSTNFAGSNSTNPTTRFNFTLTTGTYDLIVTISSSSIGKITQDIFSVNIMTPQNYINYEQEKINNAPVTNPVANWQAAGAMAMGVGLVAFIGTILAYNGWNRHREKKGATNALSSFLSPQGEE